MSKNFNTLLDASNLDEKFRGLFKPEKMGYWRRWAEANNINSSLIRVYLLSDELDIQIRRYCAGSKNIEDITVCMDQLSKIIDYSCLFRICVAIFLAIKELIEATELYESMAYFDEILQMVSDLFKSSEKFPVIDLKNRL